MIKLYSANYIRVIHQTQTRILVHRVSALRVIKFLTLISSCELSMPAVARERNFVRFELDAFLWMESAM